tara:strand:+ start:340 stop:648 length:309 start_codon:yes stop_codon:yes gene_type:complete
MMSQRTFRPLTHKDDRKVTTPKNKTSKTNIFWRKSPSSIVQSGPVRNAREAKNMGWGVGKNSQSSLGVFRAAPKGASHFLKAIPLFRVGHLAYQAVKVKKAH